MVTMNGGPTALGRSLGLRCQRKRGGARRRSVIVALGAALVVAASVAAQTPSRSASPAPLAEVNGIVITEDEVARGVGMQLTKLEEQIYQLKLQRLESLIAEKLLSAEAAKRGISLLALLDAEVTSQTAIVSEQEVDAYYQTNKAQFRNQDEAVSRGQIRAALQNEKLMARRLAFLQSLRNQGKVRVLLRAPLVYRAPVVADGSRGLGPSDAAVTIVEFTDFHCPFCKRAEETVAQILARYGNKVRLVFKDFPIDQLHPQARKAHEAARCSADQARFWEYHKLLFAGTPKATPAELKASAEQAGLDLSAFDQCVAQGTHQATVQKEIDEGWSLGVTATPTFFINGRPLSGAQPLQNFTQIIDDELARVANER
jgi:protein-disulfide isomerase